MNDKRLPKIPKKFEFHPLDIGEAANTLRRIFNTSTPLRLYERKIVLGRFGRPLATSWKRSVEDVTIDTYNRPPVSHTDEELSFQVSHNGDEPNKIIVNALTDGLYFGVSHVAIDQEILDETERVVHRQQLYIRRNNS